MGAATMGIGFRLNGRTVTAHDFPPQCSLLDYIRRSGLTGTKEGCAEGECGACAVLSVEPAPMGSQYRAVNSCLVPLAAAASREFLTVEALASNGELNAIQKAMVNLGGSQCGYCTPGFVVSMFAEHSHTQSSPRDPQVLGGNLCRCTGYRPIWDAFREIPSVLDSPWMARLADPAPALDAVDYVHDGQRFSRPTSLTDLLAIYTGEARLVAGHTDLGVLANLRDTVFPHLISLDAIPELREFHESATHVEIGAALILSEIQDRWTDAPPAFRQWMPLFASPPVRNRATLGGNLCTASPIGDAAPLLLAFDAELRLASPVGERMLLLSEFFEGYRRTAIRPGEVLRSILVPKPFPDRAEFYKVAKRRMDDISTVSAAIAIHLDRGGAIAKARVAFGGVGPTPMRAADAEAALTGLIPPVRQPIPAVVAPISDYRGSAAYRKQIAQNLIAKFLGQEVPR